MKEIMEGKDKCLFQKDKNIMSTYHIKKRYENNDCDNFSFTSLCIVTDPEFLKREKEIKITVDPEFLKHVKEMKD